MSLSIIVPMYNVEKYICECVDSVLKMSGIEYELILINDGSSDRTLQIVEEKYSTFNNIKICDQVNKGLSNTRNRGSRLSSKDYIMFLDADDLIDPEKLAHFVKLSKDSDLDVLFFSGVTFIDNPQNIINYHVNYIRDPGLADQVFNGDELLNKMIKSNYFCSACMYLYKRSKYSNLMFEEILYEDNLFTYKLISSTFTLRVMAFDDVVYYRRTRKNSIMSAKVAMLNFSSYWYVLNKLVENHQTVLTNTQRENLGYLISIVHVSLVKVIFQLDDISLFKKIVMWLKTMRIMRFGRYRTVALIKCFFPFLIIFKRGCKNESCDIT